MLKTTGCGGGDESGLGEPAQRRVLALERAHRELRLVGNMLDYWDFEARSALDATARADEAEKLADLLGELVALFATAVPVRRWPGRRRARASGAGKSSRRATKSTPETAAPST